jgi:hypothetical protein
MKLRKLSVKSCYICDSLNSLQGEDRVQMKKQFLKYHKHAMKGEK